MGKFEFYQDCKVTSWERDYFTVEANSYEEAEAIVRSWRCKDVSNIIDSRLSHGRSEALRDTSELLFPEENDGYSTIEIFNQEGESIMTNALNEDNWKSHATLTLLATQDLPTFGYNMIDPLKSWCWGAILFYPFKNSRFS